MAGRETPEAVLEELVVLLCAYRDVGESIDEGIGTSLFWQATGDEIWSRLAGSIFQSPGYDEGGAL